MELKRLDQKQAKADLELKKIGHRQTKADFELRTIGQRQTASETELRKIGERQRNLDRRISSLESGVSCDSEKYRVLDHQVILQHPQNQNQPGRGSDKGKTCEQAVKEHGHSHRQVA